MHAWNQGTVHGRPAGAIGRHSSEEQRGPPSEGSNRRVYYEDSPRRFFSFGSFLPPIFPRKNFRGIFRPAGRDCRVPVGPNSPCSAGFLHPIDAGRFSILHPRQHFHSALPATAGTGSSPSSWTAAKVAGRAHASREIPAKSLMNWNKVLVSIPWIPYLRTMPGGAYMNSGSEVCDTGFQTFRKNRISSQSRLGFTSTKPPRKEFFSLRNSAATSSRTCCAQGVDYLPAGK